jgi:hypothetical protein
MKCRYCQYEIPAEDIDLAQHLAKCRGCQQVFVFDPADLPAPPSHAPMKEAGLPGRPEKLKVVDENGQGYLQWRWFQPAALFLLFFCIAWDSFLVFWYWVALGGAGQAAPGPFNWLMIVFPVAHVAVGVGLTYFTLALLLNRTQIIYDGRFLVSRSGPIPTMRNLSLAREEIRRLETEWKPPSNRSGSSNSYQLFVVLNDGVRKPLVSYAIDPALLHYVQRQVELWLNLPAGKSVGER